MNVDECLDAWAHKNEEVFNRHSLFGTKLSISRSGQVWDPCPNASDLNHPSVDFFSTPPLIISRDYSYPIAQCVSSNSPNREMFTFDETKLTDELPRDMKTMIDFAPPLTSVFPNKEIGQIKDKRIDVGLIKPGDVSYVTVGFKALSCAAGIIEPIVINAFLWDPVRKKRLTENWRFMPNEEKDLDRHTLALTDPTWLKAPRVVLMPTTKTHPEAEFVISLDRLVLKSGGARMMKYYEKGSRNSKAKADADLKECNQPGSSSTFAWMHVPLKSLIPTGDPISYKFDKLMAGQTLSDSFLSEAIGRPKGHDKLVPLAVTLEFSSQRAQVPRLRNYFDFPPCPHMSFVHEMIAHLVDVKFKLPRGMRARNIFAQIQFISEGKPQPVFNGEVVYITRCQYHVEAPEFHEDIIMQLPDKLCSDARLVIQFMHASVKSKTKNSRSNCGAAVLELFNGGSIIADGVHKVGISFAPGPPEPVSTSEGGHVAIETMLRSSLLSSDRTVQKVFKGELEGLEPPDTALVIPHLFGVLDVIFASINRGEKDGFSALMAVLGAFARDRSHNESQYLIFYTKFCAFRKEEEKSFHKPFVHLWRDYIASTKFEPKRPDFVCCWFMLEVLTKSLVLDKDSADYAEITALSSSLSMVLPQYRASGQSIGNGISQSIALFCKDLFEFIAHSYVVEMVKQHLHQLDLREEMNWFDRSCFNDFIDNFLSPKILVYFIAPLPNGSSLFTDIFLPLIETGLSVYEHTSSLFETIYNILAQFEPPEHAIIAPQLMGVFLAIGNAGKLLQQYENRACLVYPLAVAHYILYYTKIDEVDEKLAVPCGYIIGLVRRLSAADKEKMKKGSTMSATDQLMRVCNAGLRPTDQVNGTEQKRTRQFDSLKKVNRSDLFKTVVDPTADFDEIFDALTFCVQTVMLNLLLEHKNIHSLNGILCRLLDIDTPPLMESEFKQCLTSFAEEKSEVIFRSPESDVKHIFRRLIEKISPGNVSIIERLIVLEKTQCKSSNRCTALITRALSKAPITEKTVELMKDSTFGKLAADLFEINKGLASEQLRIGNPEVYSDLLFRKAELLSRSPDARVNMLLELTAYHDQMKYYSEAVISQLTAAALVAEYLDRLGRIPHFYEPETPIDKFAVACPSAVSEVCPPEVQADLPVIRGYCTAKYFTEYGLLFLIMTASDMCKRAALFELSTKIHNLLSPIAEYRHLWNVMQKQFTTGSFAWKVIANLSTSSDRSLGTYYRVQFQDGGTFIYRETALANLWQVSARIKESAQYNSHGKPVEIVNEGDELNPEKMDPDKYYVHVKAVLQYFTAEERRKRVTVFEQNHNVSQFYFDIPFTKSAQDSIEHCWLRRTIFTLPHPMPYIVKRVEIPRDNIETILFSPIEYSCQNLQKQISLIEEASARRDFGALQPLIQGSLLVQVNEGPKKMAEVFLGQSDKESQGTDHVMELRATFRKFLKAQSSAVILHSEHAKTHPVYAVLQEELEAGLNRLTSTLQPYLN